MSCPANVCEVSPLLTKSSPRPPVAVSPRADIPWSEDIWGIHRALESHSGENEGFVKRRVPVANTENSIVLDGLETPDRALDRLTQGDTVL